MAFEAKLDKLLNQDIHDERTQYMLLQTEIEQALLLKQEVQNTVCDEHSLVVSTYQVCSAILMSFDYFFYSFSSYFLLPMVSFSWISELGLDRTLTKSSQTLPLHRTNTANSKEPTRDHCAHTI